MHKIKSFLRRNRASIKVGITIAAVLAGMFLLAVRNAQLAEQTNNTRKLLEYVKTVTEQNKNIAIQLKNNSTAQAESVKEINQHIDCMLELFKETNRSDKSIKSPDPCQISTNSSSKIVATAPQSTSPTKNTQTTQQPQPQPPHQSQTPTEPTQPNPTKPEPRPTLLERVRNLPILREIL